jgi:hypothetical protein
MLFRHIAKIFIQRLSRQLRLPSVGWSLLTGGLVLAPPAPSVVAGKGPTIQLRSVEVTGANSWKKRQSLKKEPDRRSGIHGHPVWSDIAEGMMTVEARFKKSYARAWFSLV